MVGLQVVDWMVLADGLEELQRRCCSAIVYQPVVVAPCQHFFAEGVRGSRLLPNLLLTLTFLHTHPHPVARRPNGGAQALPSPRPVTHYGPRHPLRSPFPMPFLPARRLPPSLLARGVRRSRRCARWRGRRRQMPQMCVCLRARVRLPTYMVTVRAARAQRLTRF